MSAYGNSKEEYYKDEYDIELKPKSEEEFACKIGKLRSAKDIDITYKAINSAIIIIYLFEVFICWNSPQWVSSWWGIFFGSAPVFVSGIALVTVILLCWLFNKYGPTQRLVALKQIYGRAYYFTLVSSFWEQLSQHRRHLEKSTDEDDKKEYMELNKMMIEAWRESKEHPTS